MTDHVAIRPPGAASLPDEPLRRLMDVVLAGAALALLSPLMIAISLIIWFESGGPVLFRQTRLGRGGHPFQMLKFRKFSPRAGSDGSALTLDRDPRMTPFGRVLMATKLDELPQLWNVLRGDMAVVGPRPESLPFADCFRDGLERVLDHKPGLFGPCQILFRAESALFTQGADSDEIYRTVLFPSKARIDLAYFQSRTLRSDLELVARGVLAVFSAGSSRRLAEDLAGSGPDGPVPGTDAPARKLQRC
jgi:lipopolysaccharide/colanic/teichoic acid biosynthesis glycosyltransferase